MATEKSSSSPDELALLSAVDGCDSRGITVLIAESDFSKNETIMVLHDEINLAHSTTIVPGDFFEALRLEVGKRQFLCPSTY